MAQISRYALNRTKYLLEPEVERLEKILSSFRKKDPRNCAALAVALRTGARAQEILNLMAQDLSDSDQTIFIRGLKGSNDRELPVHAELYADLKGLVPDQGRLFPIGYHRLRQIWELYRPVPKKFHSLRHTFAIRLYRRTKDIRLVQVALGHRSLTNTMIYAEYVYTQQELRKLIL